MPTPSAAKPQPQPPGEQPPPARPRRAPPATGRSGRASPSRARAAGARRTRAPGEPLVRRRPPAARGRRESVAPASSASIILERAPEAREARRPERRQHEGRQRPRRVLDAEVAVRDPPVDIASRTVVLGRVDDLLVRVEAEVEAPQERSRSAIAAKTIATAQPRRTSSRLRRSSGSGGCRGLARGKRRQHRDGREGEEPRDVEVEPVRQHELEAERAARPVSAASWSGDLRRGRK